MKIRENCYMLGLGSTGGKIYKEFVQRHYKGAAANGSEQDHKALGDVPNKYILQGFDGFGGHRERAMDCLAENDDFIKFVEGIKEDIVFMLNLYHLKDAVLKKLQEEDRVEYLGVNRQVFDYGPDSFLRLYRIGDFTFHIPCQKDEVNELEILDEEIDGEISAEKTRNVDINFRQAMLLLENYSGVKAAGTYNKKPEFY